MSRYTVIVWSNDGQRVEHSAGNDLSGAMVVAKRERTQENRTVKIGMAGNTIRHWSRSQLLTKNHWSNRATADEWFV